MNNSKKLLAVLSTAAVSTAIIAAISTPVSAKMASVVLKNSSGKLYEYNYQQLKESFTNGTALWSDFNTLKNGGAEVLSYYDDVQKSYVSRDTLIKAFINNPPDKIFDAQKETESLNTTPITEPIYEKVLNEDGTVSEQPKTLTVKSVSAITTSVFKNTSAQLGFAINGETTQADLIALTDAGYTVSYEATAEVTLDGNKGTVNTDKAFEYKVVIKDKDGKVAAESATQAVSIKDGQSVAKITKAHLQLATAGTTVGTVVVGESDKATVKVDSYEKLDGTKVDEEVAGVTYKSSNPAAVTVKSDGTLIPLAEGTANIVVSKAGMEDYSIPVTVATEARKAASVDGLSNVQLAKGATEGETKAYNLVLKDQYGDVIKGNTLTVASADAAITTVTVPDATNEKGETSFTVTAVKAGTVNVTVKAGDTLLGTAAITVKEAGAVTSYGLEYDSAKDTTLDLNTTDLTGDKLDNTLALKFVSRDAAGLLVENLTSKIGTDYTISSSKEDVATVANDGTITAKGVGTTTIAVKQGTLTRATLTITVVDTTKPAIAKIGEDAVTGEIESGSFGAFNAVKDEDTDTSTITLKADSTTAALGDLPELTFNMPVKVKAITVGGTALTSDQMAQLVLKEKDNKNLANTYNTSLDFGDVTGITAGDLINLGDTIKVTLESKSGLDNTYTITLTKAEQ